jgi:hypothetical protein
VIYLRLDNSILGEDTTTNSSATLIRPTLNAMRAWVSDMGGLSRFRSLRNVKIMVLSMCYDGKIRMQGLEVKLEKVRGLTVSLPPNRTYVHRFRREGFLGWFTASTDMRRKERGWLGEGAMDFVLGSEEL